MRSLVLLLILLAGAPALAEPTGTSRDQAAIQAAIVRWDHAWESKDAVLAARDYAEDADWTNAFGMIRKGRSAIQATLTEVFALPFVMAGSSETVGQEIRFLGPDTALVLTRVRRAGQQLPDGQALGTRQTNHLRVFSRIEGRWQIVSHLISDARDRETGKQ